MVDGVLGFRPNLIGAGIVFFVGALLANLLVKLCIGQGAGPVRAVVDGRPAGLTHRTT
ncbi:hypothetical protein CWN80_07770 [Janibacter hoylei PVAS-1]|nr:hypothetical protein CWN80_07770 [Janibacter hoylei PVAS-1]